MAKQPICKNQYNLTASEIDLSLLLAYCADAAYFDTPKGPEGYVHYDKISIKAIYRKINLETVVQIFKGNTAATNNKFIIAFRGTYSILDALTDADFILVPWKESHSKQLGADVRVHDGFYTFYKAIKPPLKGVLEKLPQGSQLYITGHSLGSAIATLFQFDLLLGGLDQLANKFQYQQINFACPRAGNWDFAQAYRNYDQGKTFRIVNYEDIVPCVPLNEMDFFHAADYWLFDFKTTKDSLWLHPIDSIAGRHSMINYFQTLYLMVGQPHLGQHPTHKGTWTLGSGNQVKALDTPKNSLNYYHCDEGQPECLEGIFYLVKCIIELIKWIIKHAHFSKGANRMIIPSETINNQWQEIYKLPPSSKI